MHLERISAMAITPKPVTKARGVGTAQAVRESDSESPAAAHKYVSFNAPEKTARIIGLAAQLEGESLKDYCISLLLPASQEVLRQNGIDPERYG